MRNLVVYKEGRPSWVHWIKTRVTKKNLNFLGLVQGPTGSGKTWSAISIAHQLDPEFNVNHHLVFTFEQLMKVINDEEFRKKKMKVIIWDEPQIQISNRAWQSKINKMMNYLLSTFRHQNIVLLFACPYKDFLDSASMKMLHGLFECSKIDYKTKKCHLRPKILQYNSNYKKFYHHSLQVARNGKLNKMRVWAVDKPPKEMVDAYEIRKTDFTKRLNAEIEGDIKKYNEEKKGKDTRKPLTEAQERVMKLLAKHKASEVAGILNLDRSTISEHKKYALKKGYSINEFKI